MRINSILILVFVMLLILFGCSNEKEKVLGTETMGEFAPHDAYLDGSKHPYYGSENEWNRRFFYEHIKKYYKRRGQRQMLDLVEGRVKDTEKYCRELLAKDPDDLESLFNLAAALAHENKIDEAMKTVKEAVDKGLPFSRFLTGPRDILKPLTESKAFRKFASNFKIQLLQGPMIGRVTDNSASFWVRTIDEVNFRIIAGDNPLMHNPVYSNIKKTSAEKDYTAIVEINNLKSNTKYYYEVFIDGARASGLGKKSFITYPAKGKSAKFAVAFGGGAGYVPPNERIWEVIKSKQPLAFLWMGDNVYINMPEKPNGVIYYTYYRRQSRPEFRDLVSSISNYAIWDDHDSATDDVWLGPYQDKPAWKMPLLDVFEENWINPSYGTKKAPACYFNFTIADVEFFMLDGRFYRTNPFDKNPTMLGPVQKAWLLDGLGKSTATFKVIASGVPWSYESKKDSKDTWNGFHNERDEIFNFLTEHKIDGVILLSADRHRSDAWEIKRDNDYSLYEFTSSRLTNQHFHPLVKAALFGYNKKQSFGMLTFDTENLDPSVTYDIFSIDNEKIHSLTITKSMLLHKE